MACGSSIRNALALGLVLLTFALATPSRSVADPIKGGLNVDVSGGYARLVFDLNDEVDASVRMAGNVLIISFTKPVLVSVDRLSAQAPDYIAAARRDPDGKAVRIALTRKVTANTTPAAEKFFVDLLPETWTGPPPGLPQDVLEALARRAREAERLARAEQKVARLKKLAPVRVRVARQPTFMRYVFDVPDDTTVSTDRAKERLTLTFDTPITFDLTDAEASLPAAVEAINSEVEEGSTLVRFSFLSKVDVRSFRDDKSYVVDIVGAETKPGEQSGASESAPPVALALEAGPPEQPPNMAPSPVAAASAGPATPAATPMQSADTPAISPAADPKPAPIPAAPPAAHIDAAPPATVPSPVAETGPSSPPPPAESASALTIAAKVDPPVKEAPKPSPAAAAAPPAAGEVAAPPPPSQRASDGETPDRIVVDLSRQGANLKLTFPFMAPTAAAVFQRADSLWIVFDSKAAIDLSALDAEASRTIRAADLTRAPDADIVRIRLDRPHLSSVATEGPVWTVTIGDSVPDPIHALEIARNMIGPNRSSVAVPFEEPHQLHRIDDPDVGDQLFVVTAFTPARGFLNPQDFVEFRALATTQGVVIEPLADDLNVELAADKVVVSRPGGLALSSSLQAVLRGGGLRPVMFDSELWGSNRQSTYGDRQAQLVAVAAAAPESKRLAPRLDLARFYISREMYPEAKGVVDVALAQDHPSVEDASASVLRAIAEVMMNRPDDALKDLANPAVGEQHDAPLWRALAYARQGKWAQAREGFKSIEAAVATLPIELQRVALKDEMRAAIEVGDFAGAADELNDFETIGVPREMQPAISVLIGRLSEGVGRSDDALSAYRAAADSWDRPAAAQGRLRETLLRYALGDLKRDDVITEFETLTTIWRGDETEVEALQILARLYTDEGRYRDSFYVMRSAMAAHPDWEMTHRIQDEAAKTFEALFLAGKGDVLPAIDALALFYDFRELTPIGHRGDEMIRRLADRLVSVDLLDQAADLLQYQVDHRLQGAARAQVATRLAVIYLMNRKSDRALATLKATRTADVSTELRNQRLLLEARALSDLGRHDLALEVIGHVDGREAIRLRSDILWAARRWSQSAEQLELLYGERWQQWQPLSDVERADILRAAIGYALGEDAIGLGRFRERYAAKMAMTPDTRAFEIVSAPLGTGGAEFRDIAHAAASVDTLENFLRDMQARYPESSSISPPASAPALQGAGATPATSSAAPDPKTPPSPQPTPPARASGRTAQR